MDEKEEIPLNIYYCSDLHLEFHNIDLDTFNVPNSKDSILLLCGDIANIETLLRDNKAYNDYSEESHSIDFFNFITNNFRKIIYVTGNHEHYLQNDINTGVKDLKLVFKRYNNLHIVSEGELIEVDDTAFVCGTMWTDFNNEDPITLMNAPKMISDFRQIVDGHFTVKPSTILKKFKSFNHWVDSLDLSSYNKTILVTHHSPTFKVEHPIYENERIMNGLFASNCEKLLSKFDYAFYGHMHQGLDVEINDCKVLSNARGYPNELGLYIFKLKCIGI
jgi:UDP-2,3-diacylglucosamine pyrophosphatase LpxH